MQTSNVQSVVGSSGVEDSKALPSSPSTEDGFGKLFSQLLSDESIVESDPDIDEAAPSETEIPDELPVGPEQKIQHPQPKRIGATSVQEAPGVTKNPDATESIPDQVKNPGIVAPAERTVLPNSDKLVTSDLQKPQGHLSGVEQKSAHQLPIKESGLKISLGDNTQPSAVDGPKTLPSSPPVMTAPPKQAMPTILATFPETHFKAEVAEMNINPSEVADNFSLTAEISDAEFGRSNISSALNPPPANALETSRAGTVRFAGAQMVDALIRQPNQPVEIALNPEELGRVRIALSHLDSGLTVVITAERPETLDLMRRYIDQLEAEFRQLGYENIGFEFSGGDADSSDQSETEKQPSSEQMTDNPDTKTLTPMSTQTTGVDIRL